MPRTGSQGRALSAAAELGGRLRGRRAEIEEAIVTRVRAIADPAETRDPTYLDGLRTAICAAIEYGLATIERGEDRAPPVPVELLAQARLAARNGVGLDTVLRRYFAGYALLGDALIEEAERSGVRAPDLQRLTQAQAALFDRLLGAVSEEYGLEGEGRLATTQQRRAERVERLLDGELLDASGLGYELGGHHLGLIAIGPAAERAVAGLAAALDCLALSVPRGNDTVWAWLGARRAPDPASLAARLIAENAWPAQTALAIGEPAAGLEGWRLTHRQAAAALPIARRRESPVRYGEVALLASVIQDDLLATSLRQIYLAPLGGDHDSGTIMRETLRAYFAARQNASSAAAALGVSRQTVNRRLHAIEERLGRPLGSCAAELEMALRLEELNGSQLSRHGDVPHVTSTGTACVT